MKQWLRRLITWHRGMGFRKFYHVHGFGDDTEYIEWYAGKATCVSETGVRSKASYITLKWLEEGVTEGYYKERT